MTSQNHFRTLAYAFLFTSMSINVAAARSRLTADRVRFDARHEMLESLVQRLRRGEDVSNDEIEQARKLAFGATPGAAGEEHSISWRDAFFGKR